MIPVIAIVGRPNVGKSTLFNCFTKSRSAIVLDQPGVTRDRQYGEGWYDDTAFIVIDTGGLTGDEEGIESLMAAQVKLAIQEANYVIFLLDGREGLTAEDQRIAQYLRQQHKTIIVVVNKTDGLDEDIATSDFYSLGLGEPIPIAAAHKRGVTSLLDHLFADYQADDVSIQSADEESEETLEESDRIKLAIVGRPNVGKSTLTNRMLGEERVLVYDAPGTTRDSIFLDMERRGKHYTLIDTAGVRRRTKVDETVEKFSVVKTLQSIKEAHVVIMLLDGQREVADQDLRLLDFVVDSGRALVIAVNKWDNLQDDQKAQIKKELERRLQFVDFAETYFISALHGTKVGDLFNAVNRAYKSATRQITTPEINKILAQAIEAHQPPLVKSRRIKLRYAHAGGQNPPLVIIHGNQLKSLPLSYQRYLISYFRKALNMVGTPVRIELKTTDNPFKDRKNELTDRQRHKRKRLKKFSK